VPVACSPAGRTFGSMVHPLDGPEPQPPGSYVTVSEPEPSL